MQFRLTFCVKCALHIILDHLKIMERRSPGLVVMGGDSCSRSCGFESQHQILVRHFFTLICCQNCIACLKRLQISEIDAGDGPFIKEILQSHLGIRAPKTRMTHTFFKRDQSISSHLRW